MQAPEADLALLTSAALEAGEIARRHFLAGVSVRQKPGGAGPVTEADLEVDTYLARTLRTARPDYGWLSEETTDIPAARLGTRRTFIVDPIDGTRSFIEGSEVFATAIAVVEDGVPLAAVVYLPMKDRLFAAARGQGATLNAQPIQASGRNALEGADVLAARPNLEAAHWHQVPPVNRHFRASLAYRLALVAQGRFDGMLTLRPSWEWDIAAGDLIAREAGAHVTDRMGQPLRFNAATPQVNGVLAATPVVHEGILTRLRPAS